MAAISACLQAAGGGAGTPSPLASALTRMSESSRATRQRFDNETGCDLQDAASRCRGGQGPRRPHDRRCAPRLLRGGATIVARGAAKARAAPPHPGATARRHPMPAKPAAHTKTVSLLLFRGSPTSHLVDGAQERTRTSTPVRALAPEASASTSSATWAGCVGGDYPCPARLSTGKAQEKSGPAPPRDERPMACICRLVSDDADKGAALGCSPLLLSL